MHSSVVASELPVRLPTRRQAEQPRMHKYCEQQCSVSQMHLVGCGAGRCWHWPRLCAALQPRHFYTNLAQLPSILIASDYKRHPRGLEGRDTLRAVATTQCRGRWRYQPRRSPVQTKHLSATLDQVREETHFIGGGPELRCTGPELTLHPYSRRTASDCSQTTWYKVQLTGPD